MYSALGPLVPTYEQCFVQDAQDALILVQAVVDKRLVAVERRPQDQERGDLIKSGNIFIFDERRGHIQRWTDGISWSPSRILGEFLIYRERKQSQRSSAGTSSFSKKGSSSSGHSPDSKVGGSSGSISKKTTPSRHRHSLSLERSQSMLMGNSSTSNYSNYLLSHSGDQNFTGQHMSSHSMRSQSAEYNLYGSLTSNEQYKENGLIKKTISIPYKSSSYRLISYYSPDDVEEKRLRIPSQDPKFADLRIQPELAETKNVKISLSIGPHELSQPAIYGHPMPSGQMSQYHLTNNRQYSLGRRIDSGLGHNEYDYAYSHGSDTRVYGNSPSTGFDLIQNRSVRPIRGRVMSDVGVPRRTFGSESGANYQHTNMDPMMDRNNFMDLGVYNQACDYDQEIYSAYSPRQMQRQPTMLNNNNANRGPSSPIQQLGSPINNKFQQQQMNTPQQMSNSIAASHSRRSSQPINGQWNGYIGDNYNHDKSSNPNGIYPHDSELTSPPSRKGHRNSSGGAGGSSNYEVMSQENFNSPDLATVKQTSYTKSSPREMSPLTAEEVSNVHPDIFASVGSGADNPRQEDGNVSSGGISASVIAGDSDSYEPLYGSTESPSTEAPLSDMPSLSKGDFGNGHSLRHKDRHDPHRISTQQQIYMPATTTAPYDMHNF